MLTCSSSQTIGIRRGVEGVIFASGSHGIEMMRVKWLVLTVLSGREWASNCTQNDTSTSCRRHGVDRSATDICVVLMDHELMHS